MAINQYKLFCLLQDKEFQTTVNIREKRKSTLTNVKNFKRQGKGSYDFSLESEKLCWYNGVIILL